MRIAHIKGDATRPLGTGIKFIGNLCSIAGMWKGKFMNALAEKWPEVKDDFNCWKSGVNSIIIENKKPWPILWGGSTRYTEVDSDITVAHMVAQDVPVAEAPFQDKSYKYLEECLHKVAERATICKASFHIQKSVAGIGTNITWEAIEMLIGKYFCDYGIRVIVYSNPIYLVDTDIATDFSSTEFSSEGLATLPSLSDAIAIPPKVITRINYKIGDATDPSGDGTKIIAHIGRFDEWNTDFGEEISRKWPKVSQEYEFWRSGPLNFKGFAWLTPEMSEAVFRMGNVQMIKVGKDIYVANMIAHLGKVSESVSIRMNYSSLAECLEMVAVYAKENNATVHIPRHEKKLTGYTWDRYKKLVEEYLCDCGIEVSVYSTPGKLEVNSPAEEDL